MHFRNHLLLYFFANIYPFYLPIFTNKYSKEESEVIAGQRPTIRVVMGTLTYFEYDSVSYFDCAYKNYIESRLLKAAKTHK